MKGSAGSAWPTAVKSDTKGANGSGSNTASAHSLATKAELYWPTLMAGTPAQNGNSAAGNSDFTRRAEDLAAAMWTTPQAHDVRKRGAGQTSGATGTGAGNRCLATDAAMWKTPSAQEPGVENRTLINKDGTPWTGGERCYDAETGRLVQTGLPQMVKATAHLWSAPRSSDGEKGGPNQSFGAGGTPPPAQAANWPTPASRDWKGENSADHLTNGTGRLHLDQLPNFVAHCFTPPDPETLRHGPKLSRLRPIWRPLRASLIASHGRAAWRRLRRGARRLNPLFVEWLMGWPPGHALCACSATEFTHWQRHMRGALSALPMDCGPWIWVEPKAAPVAVQMNLFGE